MGTSEVIKEGAHLVERRELLRQVPACDHEGGQAGVGLDAVEPIPAQRRLGLQRGKGLAIGIVAGRPRRHL